MSHRSRITVSLFLVLVAPAGVVAQSTGTLRGTVRDEARRPLANAEILLMGVPRTASTNANGSFVFDSLPGREYRLTVRLPGFAPLRSVVPVTRGQVTEVDLVMEPMPHVLDSVVVVANRRGLYGVVGDSALQPIAGAQVRVYGGGAAQATDSAGRFAFPEIRMGAYLVEATYPGLAGRPLQVNIPSRGSLEVALFLLPQGRGRSFPPGMQWIYHELGTRLSFHPSTSRMTGEQLARHAGRQLCDIGTIRAQVAAYPTIWVDGIWELKEWPLCSFNVDELSMVELTCTGAAGRPRLSTRTRSGCIRVWTR